MVNRINRQIYSTNIFYNLKRLQSKKTCIRSKHACFYLSIMYIISGGKVCSLVEPVAISDSAFCYNS